ncbi:MAG: hypothetical protein DMF56_01180 [Acidobacteria bacterium]|nr:MAG: hypothetical protein DMF56_01180 [Acidobacteriota bacterium]
MANKSDWQEASRRLTAEQREKLGDPPTAEELLAYNRGELSESEEERIRDLLVAYPELARMYGAPLPSEPAAGISEEEITAGLRDVKQRLGITPASRRRVWHYIPTTIAAALALIFFGLYVQAENRARDHERPRLLGAPQLLFPGGNRGPSTATVLRKDGEAYLLQLKLANAIHYPHYSIELYDKDELLWSTPSAEPDQEDTFQIAIPPTFLRPNRTYHLRIFGTDGETERHAGSYELAVPAE